MLHNDGLYSACQPGGGGGGGGGDKIDLVGVSVFRQWREQTLGVFHKVATVNFF